MNSEEFRVRNSDLTYREQMVCMLYIRSSETLDKIIESVHWLTERNISNIKLYLKKG